VRAAVEKKLGNFDLGKRFAKCNVGMVLEGRRLDLGWGRLTLGRMRTAQPTNPSQREHSNADPRPILKGRSLGLGPLCANPNPFSRVGIWNLRVGVCDS
jgi:hypothetical protein